MSVTGRLDILLEALPSVSRALVFMVHNSPWRRTFGVMGVLYPLLLVRRLQVVADRPENAPRVSTVTTEAWASSSALGRPDRPGLETRHAKASA